MPLLQEDEQYLKDKGFDYELHEELGRTLVVLKQFKLPSGYNHEAVDLLVIIPQLYPVTGLDMFWVIPEIRFIGNNCFPVNADVFENYLGKVWQRFSRHYPWRAHIDSLGSHLTTIYKALSSAS